MPFKTSSITNEYINLSKESPDIHLMNYEVRIMNWLSLRGEKRRGNPVVNTTKPWDCFTSFAMTNYFFDAFTEASFFSGKIIFLIKVMVSENIRVVKMKRDFTIGKNQSARR